MVSIEQEQGERDWDGDSIEQREIEANLRWPVPPDWRQVAGKR